MLPQLLALHVYMYWGSFFLFVFLIFLDLFCFRQRSKLVQNSSSVSGAECLRNTHTGVMLSQHGYLELDC